MSNYKFTLPCEREVEFRMPRTKDRQMILDMLKPGDKYNVDELVAIACLESIDGQPFKEKDARYKCLGWPLYDLQTYTTLFLEMFTVNDEDVKRLREVGKRMLSGGTASSSDSTSEPA